jgi:hypothetical protein
MYTTFFLSKSMNRGEDHAEDLGLDERIILEWMLGK